MPQGISVFEDADAPRLRLIGLKTIVANKLILAINGDRRQATLKTKGWLGQGRPLERSLSYVEPGISVLVTRSDPLRSRSTLAIDWMIGPVWQQTKREPRVRGASRCRLWCLGVTESPRESVETLALRLPTVMRKTKNNDCHREAARSHSQRLTIFRGFSGPLSRCHCHCRALCVDAKWPKWPTGINRL
jgi:hypothetical protein